jgi:flagellar biosynthesis/type III secretory pathway M-ring protein FliF/YscJ
MFVKINSANQLFVSFYTFARMYYLIGIIVFAALVFAVIRFFKDKPAATTEPEPQEEPRQVASDCCGAHEICEFDASQFDEEQIIYFDDEELDVLRNVREDQLSGEQIDDLREVLYTLRTDEIGKWLTSLARRHIHLPTILLQEARQLMAEK